MRIIASLCACLLAGTVSAFAQSASQPGTPATASTGAQQISQSAEAPTTPTPTVAPSVTHSVQTPAPAPTQNPVAQAIAKPAAQHAAKPAEQVAAPTAEVPAAKPIMQAATPSAAQPVESSAPQPAVKPADTATIAPAAQPHAKTAAAGCPGNPDALGTSRVLTITPSEFQLLGTINYKQTLPLKDHEVVLTFDDGPIPPYTNSVLDTLAANCVKATYFLVGEMAHLRPYLVRRIYNEGHSIGTHSQSHPFAFQRLSMAQVERQVNGGIDSVDNALGDPRALSPFFRIPGFGRTKAIDHFLESKGLITWSADIDTDDWWRGTTPSELIQRTMRRLNARGRGIILMHDIHPDTALALPALLKELKKEGYHVVHVVAAGERPTSLPEVVATPIEKEIWPGVLHAKSEKGGAAMSALRHRVKKVIAGRGKHHYRRTHTARADSVGKTNDATNAQDWRQNQF